MIDSTFEEVSRVVLDIRNAQSTATVTGAFGLPGSFHVYQQHHNDAVPDATGNNEDNV